MKWIRRIKKLILHLLVQRRIKQANKMACLTGQKYLVLMYKKWPRVFCKARLVALTRKGYFAKGITAQKLEENAIHVAFPKLIKN